MPQNVMSKRKIQQRKASSNHKKAQRYQNGSDKQKRNKYSGKPLGNHKVDNGSFSKNRRSSFKKKHSNKAKAEEDCCFTEVQKSEVVNGISFV